MIIVRRTVYTGKALSGNSTILILESGYFYTIIQRIDEDHTIEHDAINKNFHTKHEVIQIAKHLSKEW